MHVTVFCGLVQNITQNINFNLRRLTTCRESFSPYLRVEVRSQKRMGDRRHLYKSNRQIIGKNRENVCRARAQSRAAHLDAQRELEPSVEVDNVVSQVERLKLCRIEKNKKKRREEQLKKKAFVTVVGRGTIVSDKTNYRELNKQRRRKKLTKPAVVASAGNNIFMSKTPTEGVGQSVHAKSGGSPAHTEKSSVFNVTFEKENSSPKAPGTVVPHFNFEFVATPKFSFSNGAFDTLPQSNRRKMWSNVNQNGQIGNILHEIEWNRTIHEPPPARQNEEAAKYFCSRVDNETSSLIQMIQYWTKYKDHHVDAAAAHLDQIDDVVYQSKLLIDQKFKTFLDLCEKCRSETDGQPPDVRPSDLEEFWRTTFAEVEECNRKFEKLLVLKEKEWTEGDLSTQVNTDQTKIEKKNKRGAASNTVVAHSTTKMLRQTPGRLAATVASQNTMNAKTPSTSESPQPAATATSALAKPPSEEPHSTTETKSSLLTPNNRKVSTPIQWC